METTKTVYKNIWHKPNSPDYGPEFYETDIKPREYRGFLIYHRIDFDIILNGNCVGCYAGYNGAKRAIHIHLDGASENEFDYMARNIERI